MLVRNLKISEIYKLEKTEMTSIGILCESEFIGFAIVKPKNSIMVRDALTKDKEYKTIDAPIDEIGTEYAPTQLHDSLSKYTNKKVITKKGLQKILIQKRQGLL